MCEIGSRQVAPGDLNVLAGDLLFGFRLQSWQPSLPLPVQTLQLPVQTLQRMLIFKLGSFALSHLLSNKLVYTLDFPVAVV